MDIAGGLLAALYLLGIAGQIWLERAAARAEAEEMQQIQKDIAHLPPDVQVQLWACWHRHQADRDML